MNPRERRLRLHKSTVRDLTPRHASQARGGAIVFGTKTDTEQTNCTEPTGGCTATCNTACKTDCNGGYTCLTCGEYSCDATCTCAGTCQGSCETVCTCYSCINCG